MKYSLNYLKGAYQMRFQYQALIGQNGNWYLNNINTTPLGNDLVEVLNQLGSEGWEAFFVSDFAPARLQVLLKRPY